MATAASLRLDPEPRLALLRICGDSIDTGRAYWPPESS